MKWTQIDPLNLKIKAFKNEDEPEICYVCRIRDNEYMILSEDAYDQKTGSVEFFNSSQLKIYGIEPF